MTAQEKLVRMANQIALNFEVLGQSEAIAMTSEHIVKFWDPRMRTSIASYAARDGKDLSEIALAAIRKLGDIQDHTT